MLWPLFLHRKVVTRRRIRGQKSHVCEVIRDGETLCKFQPLVTKVEQDPSNPRRYKVTERVGLFGNLWPLHLSFRVEFHHVEDEHGQGIDIVYDSIQGFLLPKLENQMRVKETGEPGEVEVVESMEVEALCIFIPFIVGTVKRSHAILMDGLAKCVENRS